MKKYTEKYKNHSKNIIVLTGHMGSGKTSIAKALAKSLGWRFYDSDFEIDELNIYELQKQLTLLYNELGTKINYYNNVN